MKILSEIITNISISRIFLYFSETKSNQSFYNYMVPAQYFEDNKFISVEKSSSTNSAHILHARNLSTCGQSRRFLSTSIPRRISRKRKLIRFGEPNFLGFEEPNFTRWCKTHLSTFLLRISLDYQFDRKDFLRGCEMVNIRFGYLPSIRRVFFYYVSLISHRFEIFIKTD